MLTELSVHRLLAASLGCLLAAATPGQVPSLHLVQDLRPGVGSGDSNPSSGVDLNGQLVFFCQPVGTGWVPFLSDGSSAGTARINAGFSLQSPMAARVGDYVVYGVTLADGTGDVWSTDGTTAGTRRILQGYSVAAVPDRWHGGPWIVFVARRDGRNFLYRTNGEVCSYAGSRSPTHLTAVTWQNGAQVRYLTFYSADGGSGPAGSGREPWVVESFAWGTSVPALVRDLYPGPFTGFAAPADSTGFATWVDPANADLYVATIANDLLAGTEVRRLRRSFAGTTFTLLPSQEVAPGPFGAAPRDLVARGGEVFFTATNSALGRELRRLQFATGTLSSLDLEPGPLGSEPRGLVALPSPTGGLLPDIWFDAEVSGPGRELWRHDGTVATMLADIDPGRSGSEPQVLGYADGRIFFAAENPVSGRELWRTDGTPGGTTLAFDAVPGPGSSNPTRCGVIPVSGIETLLYAAESNVGRELHRVNAATPAPELVRNLHGSPWSSFPTSILAWTTGRPAVTWADGRALIVADADLWVTDGSAGNATLLLTQAAAGAILPLLPGTAIAFDDGTALFLVQNYTIGYGGAPPSLWATDGSPGGTQPTSSITTSAAIAYGMIELGSDVFFGVTFGDNGSFMGLSAGVPTIWRTSRAGDAPQQVVGPAQGISKMRDWTVVGNRIFLTGERTDGSTGRELWVWQPPAAPTLVADIQPGVEGANPTSLVAFRNRCYFVADDGTHGQELWASNGVASGTFLVRDANPGPADGTFGPLVNAGGSLIYVGDDNLHGKELWRSNGVQAGTQMIVDLRPGPGSSAPSRITAVHIGVVACTADDGVHGRELWRVDTTGLQTLYDLRPGPLGSNPYDLTWSTRHLFFVADDGVHGREPWYASWIDFQTVAMLADLAPGGTSLNPSSSVQSIHAGRHVMFAADPQDSVTGRELFAIDMSGSSTPIGTSCVQPFQVVELRSTAPILGQGLTYWVIDPGTGVPAMTLLSPRPATLGGLTLPGVACPIWVDPNNYVVVDMFTTPGNFTRTLPAPVLPTLLGATMRLQCVFDYPPMLATNGLDLVFGN